MNTTLNRKSSNLIETKAPGTLIKGNFGYRGTTKSTAANKYFEKPSSEDKSFNISLKRITTFQDSKTKHSQQSTSFE